MVAIQDLFETHLTVADLNRAVSFYRDVLKLPLAIVLAERRVAFFWIGSPGKAMLGLWETGSGPQRMIQHIAFTVDLDSVLLAPTVLRQAGLAPLDLNSKPTDEPVVLCWMPAASIYFYDPDGNQLEFLAMLPEEPRPDLGVIPWSSWIARGAA
jgi:lactoylglutathione lyase